ncbi:MobC family plasmid mobilization relaxosome protein [Pleurocapsa sp. CCALA 161]|uniref:MobC family plasmid mobilization relaxosome protein n=1 Tax=Pleurocapsa sp. CCALA 161 TaxID=2107688 RepID=UPI001304A131|nr:MobC family plasmid mobilization relaxosome protein [Pleurocapsa sp. CCALA 161]
MPTKVNKTNHIGIRATNAEKLDWELKAHSCGLKTSQLARDLLNKYSTGYASDKKSRQEFNLQVARIGNNLNQIARWANTYKGAAEVTQVVASLARIESAMLELRSGAG